MERGGEQSTCVREIVPYTVENASLGSLLCAASLGGVLLILSVVRQYTTSHVCSIVFHGQYCATHDIVTVSDSFIVP